jgi:hypothetical protein
MMRIIKAARGRITGHFGDQDVPGANVRSHLGIDIGHGDMTAADLRVGAPAPGTVTAAGWSGTYGNRIIIDHGLDADGVHWASLLAHQDAFKTAVGTTVTYDTEIGVMGSTGGNWPVHLHQELRRNGRPVDPEPFLTSTAGLTPTPIPPVPATRKARTVFAFIRQNSDGEIALVDGQKSTYRLLTNGEWLGYAARGEKYADLAPSEYQNTLSKLQKVS